MPDRRPRHRGMSMPSEKLHADWRSFSEAARRVEIKLRIALEAIPTWGLVLWAIASPILVVACALLSGRHGGAVGIFAMVICSIAFFAALSYFQFWTRLLITLTYAIYLIPASLYMLL